MSRRNMSLQSVGKISSLFISKEGSKIRVEKDTIVLDLLGITEDKYHNTNIERSILITSLSSYILAKSKQIQMPYGSLGENLLIDYDPYSLVTGRQLKIGTCILEISQNCTMCDHLSSIDERLPELLKDDRGIFAKVLEKGEIKLGDTIYLVNT